MIVEAPLPPNFDLGALRDLVTFVLRQEGAAGRWAVAIVLTDDDRLRALHRDYMGLDSPTDVITFPLGDADPGPGASLGGDVVVSLERAADQAVAYGHTPGQEALFLVIHGLLHLWAWDDTTEAERARMLGRRAELLSAFNRTRAKQDE